MPQPTPEALAHQQKLLDYLSTQSQSTNGVLSFKDFMHSALYAPGLGYYSAGSHKFGAQGDFVTAPEISPLFSQCLAHQCAEILQALSSTEQPIILELGAGSGKMAADMLCFLTEQHQLPAQYWIVEVSADLRERQQAYLQQRCPDFFQHIHWLSSLPSEPFAGIIVANEVLDAMPVCLFQISENNEVLEGCVRESDTQWELFFDTPVTPGLVSAVQNLETHLPEKLAPRYISEINIDLSAWIASLAACLQQGVMLFIDYGFPNHEYYHPSRSMGTLMCHYRHYAHSDPLQFIGLQDITAHVDFTAVALAAHACDLEIAGYTHQAAFLIGNGLLNTMHTEDLAPKEQYMLSQHIQKLTAPHEMGELFKVIALSKGFEHILSGMQYMDYRHRL